MRDLLVTAYTPALGSGTALRTYGIVRALAAAGRRVEILYTPFGAAEPDRAFRSIPGVELRRVASSRGPRRLLAYTRVRAAGAPDGFARGVSPDLAAEAARRAADPAVGRVIADGPAAAGALLDLALRRPVIYNAHNLESAFRHDVAAVSARRLRRFERKVLRLATETWMVSESDAEAARSLCPGARVRCVPNVVDVTAIAPVTPSADARRAVFVASFAYAPNRDGVRFLVDEVMPGVWRELPDARLTLAGRGLPASAAFDPRVEVRGYVDDLTSVYAGASCAVVPLLQGGGTPLKFIEALAYGLPVVATARAAAGLAVTDGEHCLLAGDADGFARALIRVLAGHGGALGGRGRALVEARYSVEALAGILRDDGAAPGPTTTSSISSQNRP